MCDPTYNLWSAKPVVMGSGAPIRLQVIDLGEFERFTKFWL
jgi:hypothetical protein